VPNCLTQLARRRDSVSSVVSKGELSNPRVQWLSDFARVIWIIHTQHVKNPPIWPFHPVGNFFSSKIVPTGTQNWVFPSISWAARCRGKCRSY